MFTLVKARSRLRFTKLEPVLWSVGALDGEEWDPLTVKAQGSCATTSSEDRAKLVKRKKLGPLIQNCRGDVVLLECGRCTAFFIDQNDFEKHKLLAHEEVDEEDEEKVTAVAVVAATADTELSKRDGSLTKPNGEPKKVPSTRKRQDATKVISGSGKWRNASVAAVAVAASSRQKVRIKIGANVTVKKWANVKKSGDESHGIENVKVDESVRTSAAHRRRSTRNVNNYADYYEGGSDAEKPPVRRATKRNIFGSDEDSENESEIAQPSVAKRRKDGKSATVRMKEENDSWEDQEEEEVVVKCKKPLPPSKDAQTIKPKEKTNFDAVGCNEVKRRKPRLKRLRRNQDDEEDDKGQAIYTCAHCLRNFRRKSNLKRHMSKLHFGKEKDEATEASKWFTGYCCDICGEGLQVRSTMMAHRDVFHVNAAEMDWCKYQTSLARVKFCNDCTKYFRAGKLFDEHACDKGVSGIGNEQAAKLLKEAEEIPPTYCCHVCSLCFRWKWDYRCHRESEHKEEPAMDWAALKPVLFQYFCEKCFKAYSDGDSLNTHVCSAVSQQLSNEAVVKPFRCDLCGNDYFWKSDFRRHMRTKHPKENFRPTEHDTIVYTCPYCQEKFSMKKRILWHMRKAHNVTSESPFVCVQCNKVFRRRDNLDRHNESYHPALNNEDEVNGILSGAEIRINGEVAYHCQICNRNISNPNRFISHYRGHYSENKFTCDLCGKQAKTQHQLNTHIKNIHLNIRNYKCDICSKSFYTKQACEEHRRIHTGERPFSCEICGKTFVAGNALISHKRFHNDFYPHSCHMCPKKFKVRRSLINHIRTHTGERPFKCDLCTKTFNNSSQYSYHKRVTHSEARPFSCALCGNCFKANKFLSRHMELHAIRSQIQSRKPNNPSSYVSSPMKHEPGGGTVITTNAITQQRVSSHVEQGMQSGAITVVPSSLSIPDVVAPSCTIAAASMPTSSQHVLNAAASSSDVYRNDDIVAEAIYNLQQKAYEPNGNEFSAVTAAAANECDMGAMSAVKRNFTAADAYMAAANYALNSNDDYKPMAISGNSNSRSYNVNQVSGNHSVTTGKHMTWL